MKKINARDWALDALIAFVEVKGHRLFAFITYAVIKKAVPDWEMPKWEKYMLFPGAAVLDILSKPKKRKK